VRNLQPLVVVTEWGARGIAPLLVLLAIAAFATLVYLRIVQRTGAVGLWEVVATSVAALAVAWLAPLLFSSDVYAYAAYGEMARLGLNPYAPSSLDASDPILRAAQWQWGGALPICVYGPGFVELARAVVAAFQTAGPRAQLDALRAIASLALPLCAVLAYGAFPGDRAARLRAAATIGLNPAAIWCSAEGHNDAIALAIALAGFALVRSRLYNAGAAIVACSAAIKLPGILAAAALPIVERRAFIGAALGIAATLAISSHLIAGVVTRLAPHGAYLPQASLQAVFAPVSPVLAWIAAAGVSALLAARGVALARRSANEGWIWLGLAVWVLGPNPYPWYAIWLVSLAALEPRSRAGTIALLLSFTAMLRYVPDAVATPAPPLAAALGLLAVLPLLALPWRCYNERLV
jgi:hypothetical protein